MTASTKNKIDLIKMILKGANNMELTAWLKSQGVAWLARFILAGLAWISMKAGVSDAGDSNATLATTIAEFVVATLSGVAALVWSKYTNGNLAAADPKTVKGLKKAVKK